MTPTSTEDNGARETIRLSPGELETNRETLPFSLEFEERVEARTAELRKVQVNLKKSNAELVQLTLDLEARVSQRTAELQRAREELEARVRARTSELEEANRELESFAC